MATIVKENYDFSAFFETSGNWTCPEKCTEILIIASGGGGGGGAGARYNIGNGNNGANGGDTIFSGIDNNITFPGGAGGAGGVRSGASSQGGEGGKSGNDFYNGERGLPKTIQASDANNANQNLGGRKFDQINCDDLILLRGGGGQRGTNSTSRQPTSIEYYGEGLQGGYGPLTTTSDAINSAVMSGGGGSGGCSVGIKKKISVSPNSIYSITIGSGGNGGAPDTTSNRANGGGGGGAGGFLAIFWNE